MKRSKDWLATLVLVAMLSAFTCQVARSEEEEEKEYEPADLAALLALLPSSKLSLADGLKLASKGAESPISAKFELDDSKKLSLSVYTAEKGLVLVSLSPRSLLEIVTDASKRQSGTVYSITPRLQARKPVLVVLAAKDGKVTSMAYDVLTGKLLWQNQRQ